MRPTAWEFRNKLTVILNMARQQGVPYVDVEAGQLHGEPGGSQHADHKLPVCCDVMKRMMRAGDSIIEERPAGRDATLTVRYFFRALESRDATTKLQSS